MERLSHDLNLALEESAGAGASAGSGGCGGGERRKLGLRRRTRSAGNLPAVCSAALEEGSSSSPGRAAGTGGGGGDGARAQPLSDSDDGKPARVPLYCPSGRAAESDSFNENLSPTRPPNARRKRKFKRMAVDYTPSVDGIAPPTITPVDPMTASLFVPSQGLLAASQINRKKRTFQQDRASVYCGKRKWSGRERGDGGGGEMRERSLSGGTASKSYFLSKSYDFKSGKKFVLDKAPKFKDKLVTPSTISLKPRDGDAKVPKMESPLTTTPALPGSSSFNFVYKNPLLKNGAPCLNKVTGFKITTELPPVFNPGVPTPVSAHKHHRKSKFHGKSAEREVGAGDMECGGGEFVDSSSLSSSDSEGVVTCDSDREGDDELTDWPGSDEISVFNRTLSLKTNLKSGVPPPAKPVKKEKFLPKLGLASCKNKSDRTKTETAFIDDEMMSDSGTLGADDATDAPFTSFGEVKNAGLLNRGVDEAFFHSFQAHCLESPPDFGDTPRSNFTLQKTSSSDLNPSERSPQSDQCSGEPAEVREIRAGCRRVRDERPGLVILSAANERLSRFLQDSCRAELRLPAYGAHDDPAERDKLRSLAKLYSLELHLELGRAVLRKTRHTTQATCVEGGRAPHARSLSEYKRRCYGDAPPPLSPPPPPPLTFSSCLVDQALLHPGDID